ncbi:hypothetical protein DPMN_159900 [Dreissena polymorpha]|uniref:Tc1-like transposase DDE domain-containing protein n=1 Tax=Dreissena polymorpha TaxID=45954 RepID=A0A9D4EJV3_DREPO|nr:hypothetical protein DPMN_159900 [Dreissena polymorpha]
MDGCAYTDVVVNAQTMSVCFSVIPNGGGYVMVWAGVSLHTKTDLVIIHGNLNAVRYPQEVMLPVAIPHLRAGGRGMVLIQDGAPAHTARATQALLQQQNVLLLLSLQSHPI